MPAILAIFGFYTRAMIFAILVLIWPYEFGESKKFFVRKRKKIRDKKSERKREGEKESAPQRERENIKENDLKGERKYLILINFIHWFISNLIDIYGCKTKSILGDC